MSSIARHRIEKGITKEELARRVGVSKRTLTRWEHGQNRPRPSHLTALAKALGCNVSDLETVNTLSDARRAAGLSQRAFAERVNIPAGSLAAIETGRVAVPDASLWARILGRTTIEIDRMALNAIEHRYRMLVDGTG